MFGYIKTNSAELKVKEYELYRGAYCGLCRSMGKCTGQCSRMSLSYDFAFLVAARLCLTDTEVSFSQKRCLVHPLKKRNVMDRNAQLDLCARAAAILAYHKIKDDIADEKGFKKLKAQVTYPFVASWRRKAIKAGLEDLDIKIAENLARLSEIEKQKLGSVDAPAVCFGDIVADIMAYGLDGTAQRIATALGRSVGKWIYIVDALDDSHEDEKRGRYNPFLLLYGGRTPTAEELGRISDALKLELCGAEAAMDILDTDKQPIKNIVENIFYLGMPETVKKIIDTACEGGRADKNGNTRKNKKGITEND